MNRIFAVLFLWLSVLSGYAQENLPLNRDVVFTMDRYLNRKDSKIFSAIKPFDQSMVAMEVNVDSALIPGCRKAKDKERWIMRKLFHEDLFIVNYEDFHLYVDPLFNFGYGRSFQENIDLYYNTRGVQIKGVFGKKLYFISSYYETQARFPDYVSEFVGKYEVAPGQGRVKNFKSTAFDYGTPYGLVSYSPNKHFNFQLGFDKHFIGDGYRSLLLSDNAFQSPFFKVYLNYGWFYYQTIFTSFQNMNTDSVLHAPNAWYHGYQTKSATFNYAGFRIAKKLELGLFEGVIFEASDKNSKFNYSSLIPVIFVNTIQYSLSDDNNALIGMTAKYKPINNLNFYGQVMVDNLNVKKLFVKGYQGNTWGFQLGSKYFNMFGLQNLNLQMEYNQVRPYAYAHQDALQSYTHFNQSLAHPLGANFQEVVGFVNYRYRRLFAEWQCNYALTGLDTSNTNWGQNVFASQLSATPGYQSENNRIAQGAKTYLFETGIRAYYLFNPKTNLQFEVGYFYRNQHNELWNKTTGYFYFGLKTSLTNVYHDF
jgi:hypothetical protein